MKVFIFFLALTFTPAALAQSVPARPVNLTAKSSIAEKVAKAWIAQEESISVALSKGPYPISPTELAARQNKIAELKRVSGDPYAIISYLLDEYASNGGGPERRTEILTLILIIQNDLLLRK